MAAQQIGRVDILRIGSRADPTCFVGSTRWLAVIDQGTELPADADRHDG
jgi:hypothetical protein